jgi:hypothetical protein
MGVFNNTFGNTFNAQLGTKLNLSGRIENWQSDPELVYVSNTPYTQWNKSLYQPNPTGHGNTYIEKGHAIRQVCTVKKVKVRVYDFSAGAVWNFKIFRYNRISGLYDCVFSEGFTPTTNDAFFDLTLQTPFDAQIGDVPGLYLPATDYNRVYVMNDISKASTTGKYVSDLNVGVGESNAFATAIPNQHGLSLGCYSNRPYAAYLADSLYDGGNGATLAERFWSDQPAVGVYTEPGGFPGNILNCTPHMISTHLPANFRYQNFAKGGSTFADIVVTNQQLARAVFCQPKLVHIHCGVNDIQTDRTWAQIEANLNTIRTAFPAGTEFILDEILPYDCTDVRAANLRAMNAHFADYCTANGWKLVLCHDEMAIVRGSTGELDNLAVAYRLDPTLVSDSVHLNTVGVAKLAEIAARYYK